jgi:hypothetical protein
MIDRPSLFGLEGDELRRTVVGGLVFDRPDVWILIGNRLSHRESSSMFDDDIVGEYALKICKGILEGSQLLMGQPDRETDQLLSDLLLGEDCGEA